MKCLFTALSFLFLFSCKHIYSDPDDAYIDIRQDTVNVLHIGDSALIYVSYPQGTAYYQYEFQENQGRVKSVNHTINRGNPDEAGGGMSETFYIRAIKPGIDTIRIVDQSPAAVTAAQDTLKSYKNYEEYILRITDK